MAFNPFRNFQKNRKYWMAGVLLMCMLTFVVCTGVGGDLSERILQIFNARAQGEEILKLNGRTVKEKELRDLKERREIAQKFMSKLMDFGIDRLKNAIEAETKAVEEGAKKGEEKIDQRRFRLFKFQQLQQELADRKSRQYYFETGTRLDDLADFMVWLEIADRLNIRPRLDDVQNLVRDAVFGRYLGFDPKSSREIQNQIKFEHYGASDDVIVRALTDEFRVRIAKLACVQVRSQLLFYSGPDPAKIPRMDHNQDKFIFEGSAFPTQVRLPLTPEQVFAYYVKTRTRQTLDVLPVMVEEYATRLPSPEGQALLSLVGQAAGPPHLTTVAGLAGVPAHAAVHEKELREFFNKYKNENYDPNSDKPGFKFPKKVKVAYFMADPDAPAYRQATRAVTTLQSAPVPGLLVPVPGQGPLGFAANLAARPVGFEANLGDHYNALSGPGLKGSEKFYLPGWRTAFATLNFFLNEPPRSKEELEGLGAAEAKQVREGRALTVAGVAGAFGGVPVTGLPGTTAVAGFAYLNGAVREQERKWAPAEWKYEAEGYRAPNWKWNPGKKEWEEGWFGRYVGKPQPGILAQDTTDRAVLSASLTGMLAQLPLAVTPLGPTPLVALADTKATVVHFQKGAVVRPNTPLDPTSQVFLMRRIPLQGHLRDQVRLDAVEKPMAQLWARRIMENVEKELEEAKKNKDLFARTVVPDLWGKYAGFLRYEETQGLYHKYNIASAPELKALRTEYEHYLDKINSIEGRGGTSRQLRDDDFYKLFFEGERFSVGNQNAFFPETWPPRKKVIAKPNVFEPLRPGEREKPVDLFKEARRPAIFWWTGKKDAETDKTPRTLDAARAEVEQAWKNYQAAKGIQTKVGDLTEALRNAEKQGKSFEHTLDDLSREVGRPLVPLHDVSPLVPHQDRLGDRLVIRYAPYELPRNKFEFPRADTLDSLLAMGTLKEPISTEKNKEKYKEAQVEWLDKLNKKLFESRGKTGYTIQVLTNRPQTAFYVVTARNFEGLTEQTRFGLMFGDFRFSVMGRMREMEDTFVDQCQAELGREFLASFMAQITAQGEGSANNGLFPRTITNNDARRHFDIDVAPSK
jgi:hypothetical protein